MHTASSSSHLLGGLSQCMLGYTPRCGPWTPLGVGPGTPLGVVLETPQPDPSTSPLGVDLVRPLKLPLAMGLVTCKACWDTTPWIELQTHVKHNLAPPGGGCLPGGVCLLGGVHLPPRNSILDTHLWKCYLFASTVADGKKHL